MPQTGLFSSPPPRSSERPGAGPPLPRELVFVASLWLVGSWLVAIGARPPLQPSASAYMPGVRTMLLCIVIGLTIAWPLMRVSQSATSWPVRRTLLDLVALLALAQVVIWPVRLVTTWTVDRTFAIAVFVIGWTAIVGAIVAATTGPSRHPAAVRGGGMAGCCALCLIGPVAALTLAIRAETVGSGIVWDGSLAGWLGPLMGLQVLTRGTVEPVTGAEWRTIFTVLGGAGAVWLVVPTALAIRRSLRSSSEAGEPEP